MRFVWDARKNRANAAKHGVGFELAARIFEGPRLTWIDDREDYGELREVSIAWSMGWSPKRKARAP